MAESAGGETVKLISKEGSVFVVDKAAACVSGTIKAMLSSSGTTAYFTLAFVF
jgi:hypothetical protein